MVTTATFNRYGCHTLRAYKGLMFDTYLSGNKKDAKKMFLNFSKPQRQSYLKEIAECLVKKNGDDNLKEDYHKIMIMCIESLYETAPK